MNIYTRELKANLKSIIIWSIMIILFTILGFQKYEAFIEDANVTDEIAKMMQSIPRILKLMLGMSEFDSATPIGYLGVFYIYFLFIVAVHAGMLGVGIISKEERDKTAEFLMVKPVSRKKIVIAKLLAALTNVVIFNLVILITTILCVKTFIDTNLINKVIILMIGLLFMQLLFLAIGISIAKINKKHSTANNIMMGIILGSYFLSVIVDMSDKLELLRFLTPFKYFEAKELLLGDGLNIWYILLTIVLIISMLLMSYKVYKKRDLNI